MEKGKNPDDYDAWNEKKKLLDNSPRNLLFKEGEIWWCSLGLNIGEEVFGKGAGFTRPVVVLKKLSHTTCIVLPTSTMPRKGSWYHSINVLNIDRWVMMNQIRSISTNRLYKRESVLSTGEFHKLKKSVATLLGLFQWSPEVILDRWVIPNVILVYNNEIHIANAEYVENYPTP